jgi:hypothetical protein
VKLRMALVEVVGFLASLPGPVRAVYEAGPTGFGLAGAGVELGIEVRVGAAGEVPRASGDRVRTDRRDAERLARLLAAGELHFAHVPSVADEQLTPGTRLRSRACGAFAGSDALSAAGVCAEVSDWRRSPRPAPVTRAGGWSRPPTTTATRPPSARPLPAAARPGPPSDRGRLARPTPPAPDDGRCCASAAASPPASSRSPARASSPRSARRLPRLTDHTPTTAPGDAAGARTSTTKAHDRRARLATLLRAAGPGRWRPLLDSEPRRTPRLEVEPSNISLTPPSTRLDLRLMPPRQRPRAANQHSPL